MLFALPKFLYFNQNYEFYIKRENFQKVDNYFCIICILFRYTGMYEFFSPTLVLRDLDLIKQITVKDFDNFVDHRSLIPLEADVLWSKNLFALTGM